VRTQSKKQGFASKSIQKKIIEPKRKSGYLTNPQKNRLYQKQSRRIQSPKLEREKEVLQEGLRKSPDPKREENSLGTW
jgi:hypothetical protein